jgi:hypothetical protein
MAKINFLTILKITVFLVALSGTTAAGRIIYVDDDAAGANDGTSWDNAYNYLQDALAVASDGDEIHVAQGIYTPDCNSAIPDGTGDREATFKIIGDISLKGGYTGFGQINPDARDIEIYETILSGDLNGDDADVNNPGDLDSEPTREENSYHVVTSSSNTLLDGFIITGGNANGIGGRHGDMHNFGGGIYNDEGSPTLIDCTFVKNYAALGGGGIVSYSGNPNMLNCKFTENFSGDEGGAINNLWGDPNLTNCTFQKNLTIHQGGGLSNYQGNLIMTNCVFNENSVHGDWPRGDGGAIRNYEGNPTLIGCIFMGNNSSRNGGGISDYYSSLILKNCTFKDNLTENGGGLYCYGTNTILNNCTFTGNMAEEGGGIHNNRNSNPVITNCIFTDNTSEQGGAIYNEDSNSVINNCIFTGNLAREEGGVIYIDSSNPILTNCTFTSNSADVGDFLVCDTLSNSKNSSVELKNCIIRESYNGIWIKDESTVTISYSNIYGGWPGEGNIDVDPLFVDELGLDHVPGTENDDLRLVPVSPCVDTGDPDYAIDLNETDLDSNPRIVSGRIDMGAYEFQGNVYVDDDAPYEQWQGEPQVSHLEEDGSEARPFDTIQEAIDIAKDGYSVLVQPGLYGKIDFKGKAITVTGIEGAATIEAQKNNWTEDAVTFHTGEGSGSILRNFIIRNSDLAISLNFSSPKIYNVTIADNGFGIAAYENSNPDIRNCILWNNRTGDLFQCQAWYSCVESGSPGQGNINVNPLFVDAANGDYHLKSEGWRWNIVGQSWTWDDVTSRCIDAGDPCSPLGDEPMSIPRDPNNLYGENRYINMGAYGGTCQAGMPPLDWPPTGEDRTPPAPNPAQWTPDGAPHEIQIGFGTFDYWVEMKAQPATDASGFVEYFFECTTNPGFSSGWLSSPTYLVQIGRSGQGLRFRVKARDLYLNETAWSDERTAH